jgi:hypothetical protein
MMQTKAISETLVFSSTLTRLIAREDFSAFLPCIRYVTCPNFGRVNDFLV